MLTFKDKSSSLNPLNNSIYLARISIQDTDTANIVPRSTPSKLLLPVKPLPKKKNEKLLSLFEITNELP